MTCDIANQGFVGDIAYEIGRQCPIGQEVDLLIGLSDWWAELADSEAHASLLAGLGARFSVPR